MVDFKLSNENNVKSELINMTQAWNKENSESLPGVQEVMDSFPIRDSDFSLFHTHVMLISSLFTLNTLHNKNYYIESSLKTCTKWAAENRSVF